MGGFVPVEAAVDTVLTNPLHYGAGGFEGIRIFRTPYGDGFVELAHNIARFIYSSLAFNLSLITQTMKLFDDPAVDHVTHVQRTPREFFRDSVNALKQGEEVKMKVKVHYKNGTVENKTIPFRLSVKFGDTTERTFSLEEMEAAICSLAFLNCLVREGTFPHNELRLILGGYFRPVFWVSGEEGLKVPTLIKKGGALIDKPLYFALATLPWGLYLDDKGYKEGLNVLIAPLRRIDSSMPVHQKIAGDYVNSARNINIAMRLGFGEILALNHNDEIVEGSAENIVILFTHKKTGEMKAFCPPLSADILAGTTRDRVLRILEEGIYLSDKKIELVMEAPKKDFIFDSLAGKTDFEVSAIVFIGTGVGIIHARSLTYNPALIDWMGCNELRSEEVKPNPLVLRRLAETEVRYPINNEVMHPFVDALKRAYLSFVLADDGAKITPVYMMNWCAVENIFGVSMDEFANKEFRLKAEKGYFNERINGVKQPDEINKRYIEVMRALRKAVKISMDRRCVAKIPSLALKK
jgi:branched-subunit amino acid aminotransferase/4-amino-4-deoxychorismate lyase